MQLSQLLALGVFLRAAKGPCCLVLREILGGQRWRFLFALEKRTPVFVEGKWSQRDTSTELNVWHATLLQVITKLQMTDQIWHLCSSPWFLWVFFPAPSKSIQAQPITSQGQTWSVPFRRQSIHSAGELQRYSPSASAAPALSKEQRTFAKNRQQKP